MTDSLEPCCPRPHHGSVAGEQLRTADEDHKQHELQCMCSGVGDGVGEGWGIWGARVTARPGHPSV